MRIRRLAVWLQLCFLWSFGCDSDLALDLEGRECGPTGECISGYACDPARNICVRPNLVGTRDVCNSDELLCEGRCISQNRLATDVLNCGACAVQCPQGASCVRGECTSSTTTARDTPPAAIPEGDTPQPDPVPLPGATTCALGLLWCIDRCVDTNLDAAHCGACGASCVGPSGGTSSCIAGKCVVACSGERVLCDGECVDIKQDERHCGGCGKSCNKECNGGKCKDFGSDKGGND